MTRILLTGQGYAPEHFELLAKHGFEVIHLVEVSSGELSSLLPTVKAYVLGGNERLGGELLAASENLEVISFVGTDFGNFIDSRFSNGITVLNTPGIMTQAVAEHTVGLIIGLVRGIFAQNEGVKRSRCSKQTTPELSDITIGIVGMGRIGQSVTRLLTAFGCRIKYNSRSRKPRIEDEFKAEFVKLDALFSGSDAVGLLVPKTAETAGMIDEKLFSVARRGIFLINTSSAELVKPNALKEALESGQVAAAAFDGYWIEPPPEPNSDPIGLLIYPDSRFVITPHTAAKTTHTWSKMLNAAINNLINFYERRS